MGFLSPRARDARFLICRPGSRRWGVSNSCMIWKMRPPQPELRADLILAGATEAPSDGKCVILLTNRSTTAWLSQQAELLEKGVVTVIGSAIGLPKSLQWLWRRQWIDLRRWDATRKRKNPCTRSPRGNESPAHSRERACD